LTGSEVVFEAPDLRQDGKVVWITGASRGLGRSLAHAFAAAGAEVVLTARSVEALERVADDIRKHGGIAHVAAGSIADAPAVDGAARLVEERCGRVDVLINNAGVSPTFERAESLAQEDLRQVFDVNLFGAFACCKAAAALMPGGGSIVNLSSVHASAAHERLLAYAASKGALEMVTRTLAVEWASRGIRVNSIAPGYLETDMTAGLRASDRWRESLLAKIPLGRFGSTSEIVGGVLFLAGSASSYITGATLYADGGWTAQ